MRTWMICGLATALGLALLQPASAQQTPCIPGPSALGVSRTIEVDTSAGPRFGGKKKDQELLQDGEVVLTFDDGPLPAYTRIVLDALDAHCTKATFFLVGRMAVAYPEWVREYERRGHTVGTHTWSHPHINQLTPLRARHEIELGFSAVQQAMGKSITPFFRFPYLLETGSMVLHLQGRHVAMFGVDIDSKDYLTHDGGIVRRRVMAELAVAKKGIILFHDIQASTAHAIAGVLADLKAQGFRVVHLVSKDPATTVPEFDAIANKSLARKLSALSSSPLAQRSLTWPVTTATVPTDAAATPGSEPAAPAPRRRHSVRRKPAPVQSDWVSEVLR